MQYYDLMRAVSERGAWFEWLLFFLVGVAEQAQDAASRARALLDIQQQWHQRLGKQRSANLLRLADMLLSRPVLTIPDAQKMLGVTYHTARNQVEKLAAANILSPIEETNYGRLYAANEILKILQ